MSASGEVIEIIVAPSTNLPPPAWGARTAYVKFSTPSAAEHATRKNWNETQFLTLVTVHDRHRVRLRAGTRSEKRNGVNGRSDTIIFSKQLKSAYPY